jgi:hypothetical protein
MHNYLKVNECDRAELKVQFKQLYKQVGYEAGLRCLYEILVSGEIMAEVLLEERQKEMEI